MVQLHHLVHYLEQNRKCYTINMYTVYMKTY